MKEIYQMEKDEVFAEYGGREGLTSQKAKEILLKDGDNVLEEGKKKSTFAVFIGQFADLLVIILIVAAIVSMVSGNVESTVVIFAVIILNAILGTV